VERDEQQPADVPCVLIFTPFCTFALSGFSLEHKGGLMPGEIISLPPQVAEELLEEDLVEEPVVWRGTDVVSLLSLAADMTSAVTAVVVARESIGAVVRRLVHHASQTVEKDAEIKIVIGSAEGTDVLLQVNTSSGVTRLEVDLETLVRNKLDRLGADGSSHEG
jgi:hypothetical protein